MKIISVFVTLCAIALNLSFGAASRDYRYPHDLNNNRIPIRDHIGTRNGETFLNVNFDTAHTYPHAPFAPKGPIREHTVESHSTNHTRRGNVKCGQPPRAPFAPNGDCGNRTDASTVTVSPVFHIRRPHGPHSYRLNPPTGPGGSVDVSGRTPKRPHGPDDIVVEKRDAAPAEENEIFYSDTFSHELVEEKDKTMANIADVWKDCNDQFRLPWGKALKFFDNSAKMEPDMSEKYLVDCTLRGMGVMMNDSFQEEEYLLQIHKLLLSYATFDINVQSKEVKDLAWDAIGRQLMERFSQNENCYPIGSRLKEAVKLDTMNANIPDKLKWIASYQIPDICMELLKSYEMAVRECKNVKAPTGQSYETAWLIVQCITEGNQNRMFDAPFYPGVLYTATLKVPRT